MPEIIDELSIKFMLGRYDWTHYVKSLEPIAPHVRKRYLQEHAVVRQLQTAASYVTLPQSNIT